MNQINGQTPLIVTIRRDIIKIMYIIAFGVLAVCNVVPSLSPTLALFVFFSPSFFVLFSLLASNQNLNATEAPKMANYFDLF